MTASISIAQDSVLQDLGTFISGLFSDVPVPVIRGLVNRAAMPQAKPGFISMTPAPSRRLSTNRDRYTDPGRVGSPPYPAGTTDSEQPTRLEVQIDCYGSASADWAQILSVVLRGEYGCQQLTTCQPLHADDPVQLPLMDGEQQYEERWVVRAFLQYNPVVSTPMQFADTIPQATIYPPVNAQ